MNTENEDNENKTFWETFITKDRSDKNDNFSVEPNEYEFLRGVGVFFDEWYGKLKEHISLKMKEVLKARAVEAEKNLRALEFGYAADKKKLRTEITNLNKTIGEIESAVARKDELINSLKKDLKEEKDSYDILVADIKAEKHKLETKTQILMANLATVHHKKVTTKKLWNTWQFAAAKMQVQNEKQKNHLENCIPEIQRLKNQVSHIKTHLKEAQDKLKEQHIRREEIESGYRDAFLRGLCALNLETLAIFKEQDDKGRKYQSQVSSHPAAAYLPDSTMDTIGRTRVNSFAAHCDNNANAEDETLLEKSEHTTNSVLKQLNTTSHQQSASVKGSKSFFSSVSVEGYHPVTKQTVGVALASQPLPVTPTSCRKSRLIKQVT